jgi:hypothetical protein
MMTVRKMVKRVEVDSILTRDASQGTSLLRAAAPAPRREPPPTLSRSIFTDVGARRQQSQ